MTRLPPDDPVSKFIAEVKWVFAKTMPKWPHWYVVKDQIAGREAEFMELVRLVADSDTRRYP
jgi:hypothetical protein